MHLIQSHLDGDFIYLVLVILPIPVKTSFIH